jgi:hypothetical protein
MFGFFIKKAFFDGWDNLFTLVAMNAGFILLLALGVFIPPLFSPLGAAAGFGASILFLLAGVVWFSATVHALVRVADFKSIGWAEVLEGLKAGWIPGLQLGGIAAGMALALGVGIPFYLGLGTIPAYLAGGLLFWAAVAALLVLQYFLPLHARLGGGFRKNLRKSLLLFLDNTGFSLFLALHNLISLVVSAFLAFLLPGGAGIALALDVGLRLRLLKYDWLEEHPGADRRKLPWGELLAEDRELLGTRTLRGMIFPWKE